MIHFPRVCSIILLASALRGRSSENHSGLTASIFSIVDLSNPWPLSKISISSNLQPGYLTLFTAAISAMLLTP